MGKTNKRYFFGRLNLIATFENKDEFLYKGITTEKLIPIRNHKWGFFNVEKLDSDFGLFFTGYLAKYKQLTEEETVDENRRVIDYEKAAFRVTAKSRFVLNSKTGIIIFRPIGSLIPLGQFTTMFCDLFMSAHDNFFVNADIQMIDEKYWIFDTLPKFEYISKVIFNLHPSNPRAGDWKKIDDRLKQLNATAYREELIGNESTPLNVKEDQEIHDKTRMALDGYGNAAFCGKIDGKIKTISTHDNPKSMIIQADDSEPEIVLKELSEGIKEVIGRYID